MGGRAVLSILTSFANSREPQQGSPGSSGLNKGPTHNRNQTHNMNQTHTMNQAIQVAPATALAELAARAELAGGSLAEAAALVPAGLTRLCRGEEGQTGAQTGENGRPGARELRTAWSHGGQVCAVLRAWCRRGPRACSAVGPRPRTRRGACRADACMRRLSGSRLSGRRACLAPHASGTLKREC